MHTSTLNMYTTLQAGFPADKQQVALETPERMYTWDELETHSAQLANLLHSLGLAAGERVMVQVEKSPQALFLYLAVLRAGLVYVPLNTAYSATEMAYFVQDASPAVVVGMAENTSWLKNLAQKNNIAHVFTLEDNAQGSLLDAALTQSTAFTTVLRAPTDLATILYTSGTTGRSKGAMLTHGNLIANAQTLHTYWEWSSHDVLLHMLPIFHIHGLFVATHGALLAGAKMIWLPKFNAAHAVHYLPKCTVMMGVPTYYVRLLAQAEFDLQVCRSMRLFISGSAPLLKDTFDEFKQRTGMTILERYGLSETIMNTSNPCNPELGPRLAGTVGPALPGVSVRIRDESNQAVAVGQPGHVQVKGPNVFAGYWQMPEKTAEEFTADGWFNTGDIGVLGGQGIPDQYLSIVGRSKDLIISGGYNVYPKEIELLIDEQPAVLESAVIGVPHADFGEAVVALVVPQANQQPDLEAIQQYLGRHLANYKQPKVFRSITALPRNTMGKVQKNVLREQYASIFAKN